MDAKEIGAVTVRFDSIPRGVEGDVVCPDCSGVMDNAECTPEERKKYGCGRTWDCCSVAFVCKDCGGRFVGRRNAPEMY